MYKYIYIWVCEERDIIITIILEYLNYITEYKLLGFDKHIWNHIAENVGLTFHENRQPTSISICMLMTVGKNRYIHMKKTDIDIIQ